jgi:hypothetical protein
MVKGSWRRQLHQPEREWSLEDQPDDELQVPEDVLLQRALSCLMIPGEDLLDVRALWRDVQALNCTIRYLGFNEGQGSAEEGTRVHVSNNAVTSLPGIIRDSCVVQDRFEAIASQDSQAYHYLMTYGPYHVVNLDLCGSMFPNTAKDVGKYYDALLSLLTYQFAHQKTEWLLFITTMVEPSVVHADELKKLCGPICDNYHRYTDFAEQVGRLIPAEAFPASEPTMCLSALSEEQLLSLFGVAFGKWLLALCRNAHPQWTIAMRRSYRYSIKKEKGAVMLSLAFELKPNVAPPVDSTGMAKVAQPAKKVPDERECALKLTESVANIRDVDRELASQPDLRAALLEAKAKLLESAGYDRAAYVRWVSDGEMVLSK